MDDLFDDFAADLQAEIDRETREYYGEKVFQRWKNPVYMGEVPGAHAHASETGSCGDTIQVFLKFEDGRVCDGGFLTDGCGASMVCGSYAVEKAMGRTPEEIMEIKGGDIINELGGLPEENEHCAFLAAAALQSALEDYMSRRRSS